MFVYYIDIGSCMLRERDDRKQRKTECAVQLSVCALLCTARATPLNCALTVLINVETCAVRPVIHFNDDPVKTAFCGVYGGWVGSDLQLQHLQGCHVLSFARKHKNVFISYRN